MQLSCTCGKPYEVADDMAGHTVKCQACGKVFKVPGPATGVVELSETDYAPTQQQYADYTGTVASNSGRMRPDYFQIIRCYPMRHGIMLGVVAIGLLEGLAVHPSGFIVAGVFATAWLLVMSENHRAMANGDVNPGLVLSVSPCLIATYTNMSTRHGFMPAIDIRKHPLGMSGHKVEQGIHLAMLCQYGGRSDDIAWRALHPRPVVCLTGNSNDIARTLASTRRAVNSLDKYVAQLPDYGPGLYRMWEGGRRVGNGIGLLGPAVGLFVVFIALFVPLGYGAKAAQGRTVGERSTPAIPQVPAFVPTVAAAPKPPPAPIIRVAPPATPKSTPAKPAVSASAAQPPSETAVPPPAAAAPRASTPVAAPGDIASPRVWKAGDRATLVRDGKSWAVTVVRTEGRRVLITPENGPDVWVGRNELSETRGSAQPSSTGTTFNAGDFASVLDHVVWRKAKVLKVDGSRYFIHYEGWSNVWDEWVPPERIKPLLAGQ